MNRKAQSKVYDDAAAALFDLRDGIALMSGGFGLCGIPENSIKEVVRQGIKNIHAISNNIGNSGRGLALLLKQRQISEATCSYVGGNPDLEVQMLAKEVKVNLVPQGTFSERIRAAGMGIRGFYTPTGYGTIVADGKEIREFDRPCLLELPLDSRLCHHQGSTRGYLWEPVVQRDGPQFLAVDGDGGQEQRWSKWRNWSSWARFPPKTCICPAFLCRGYIRGTNTKTPWSFPYTQKTATKQIPRNRFRRCRPPCLDWYSRPAAQ